jgi:hypothetical protein
MPVGELATELVETALTFAPWLVDIPVLGRILVLFAPHGGNDIKALEELQRSADQKKQERTDRIKKNARYVLKASDAMQCVADSLGNGGFLLELGKALLNQVAGRTTGVSAPDVLMDKIFACIESKTLRQDTPRTLVERKSYHRPARGHGKGRESF